jgi:hypothetical protein
MFCLLVIIVVSTWLGWRFVLVIGAFGVDVMFECLVGKIRDEFLRRETNQSIPQLGRYIHHEFLEKDTLANFASLYTRWSSH